MAAAPMITPGTEPMPPISTMENIRHDSQKLKLSGETTMSLVA